MYRCTPPQRPVPRNYTRADRRLLLLCAGLPVLAGSTLSHAAVQAVSWIGASGGNWSVGTNWSGGVVPNNGADTYNVFIDGGNPSANLAVLNVVATIDNLALDAGDQLTINNATSLTIAGTSIANSGLIGLNSVGSSTGLVIGGASVALSGGGTVLLGNHTAARIIGSLATNRLVNSDNYIAGLGQLGLGNLLLTNHGTIAATSSTLILSLSSTASNINSGVLRGDGGLLIISSTALDNSSGTLDALGSNVRLVGSSVSGGVLQSFGTFQIEGESTNTLNTVTNNGHYVVQNASTTSLAGIITNAGSITVSSAGSNTNLTVGGATATLNGAGTVNLVHANSRILGSGTLVNHNTIRGLGQIGVNAIAIINNGLIAADQTGSNLTLDADANGVTNNGTIRAENGGRLSVTGTSLINTGTLAALSGSTLSFGGSSSVTGGTLSTIGSGLIEAGGVTLQDLTNAGAMTVPNATSATLVGTISNPGSITINSAGSNTNLLIGGATSTLTGAGTVHLVHANSRILGSGTLVNNNTIRGLGRVGAGSIAIVNNGLITADVSAANLTIDTAAGGLSNSGILRAEDGGRLIISSTAVSNSATIEALNGSTVTLSSSSSVTGGTLSTSGAGVIEGPDATLHNLTISGRYVVPNAGDTLLIGTIVNQGTLVLSSAGSNTYFQPVGSVTIGGAGVLEMSNRTTNWIYGTDTTGELNNGPLHTITGGGNVGWTDRLKINNAGTISAIQSVGLIITPNVHGMTNAGTLLANGGTLRLNGGTYNNAGGIIKSIGTSIVELNAGAVVSGGQLDGAATGGIRGESATLDNLTNNGFCFVPDTGNTQLSGTITNNGTFLVASANSNTYVQPVGSVMLAGTGVLQISDGSHANTTWVYGTDATAHLINAAGHTIRGAGNLGWTDRLKITNAGLIDAVHASPLIVTPNSGGLLNTGTIQVSSGGRMNLSEGSYDTVGGTFRVLGGGTLAPAGGANLSGDLKLDGVLTGNSGTFTVSGSIHSVGSIDVAGLSIVAGNVRVAALTAANPSRITIAPNGTSSGTSRLSDLPTLPTGTRLDLTNNDLIIDYSGASPVESLRTRLQTASNGGAWNVGGLTSSSAGASSMPKTGLGYIDNTAGAFGSFSGLAVDNTSLLVKYTYVGDTNLDGQVDITDLGNLATNWQASGRWDKGDFDYSGFIDITDLGALATNWQAGVGSPLGPSFDEALAALGLPGATVPEPSGAAVLLALAGLRRRCRATPTRSGR